MKQPFNPRLKLTLPILGIFLVSLVLVACAGSPEAAILGKWQVLTDTGTTTWEFLKDGTVITTEQSGTLTGNYRFIDSNRIRVDFNSSTSLIFKLNSVSSTQLVLSNSASPGAITLTKAR